MCFSWHEIMMNNYGFVVWKLVAVPPGLPADGEG
jgi:hypothetical protein